MKYEFYIYSKEGDDVWHWNLTQTKKVIEDIKVNKNDDTFSVEVLTWLSENNCEYTEIYPKNNSQQLPNYIQNKINKVLQGVKNEI